MSYPSISCGCKGTGHDSDCWTQKPATAFIESMEVTTTFQPCSCGHVGHHSLPVHLRRLWFPNLVWRKEKWGR